MTGFVLGRKLISVKTPNVFHLNLYLAFSQKRAVESSCVYHEGVNSVVELNTAHDLSAVNEGRLVHVSGYLSLSEPLQDEPYGVSIRAVKLKRRVQMYQWVERKKR